jgi:hypothetical protein
MEAIMTTETIMTAEADEIDIIAESLIFDLTKAFGLPPTESAKSAVRLLLGKVACKAAQFAMEVDHAVAAGGAAGGARKSLPHFVKSYEARGLENIPPTGPLIVASNHPAFIDSFVITAFMERPDYKIIIGDIPFLENMPHIRNYAIFAPEEGNTTGRMQVIRESIRHLRQGGALLIFPRGAIEADPEFMSDPGAEFHYWSRSLEIFMRRVPNLQILATAVSGVISPAAMRHPITWLRKARPDKQRLAFIYQLAWQILGGRQKFDLSPRVTFGEILAGNNHEHVLAEVEQAACRTLEKHMAWKHV